MSLYSLPLATIFPLSSQRLPADLPEIAAEKLPEYLDRHPETISRYPYLADLVRIELSCHLLKTNPPPVPDEVAERTINPSLELLPVQWSNLPELFADPQNLPLEEEGFVLVYQNPDSGEIRVETPTGHELLALKLVSEGIDSAQASAEGGVSVGKIDDILYAAIDRGLILAPPSKLIRDSSFPRGAITDPECFTTQTFTLQWHITQKCDLHCRHCYDRSDRKPIPLDQAVRVLDELYDFCKQNHVFGQVSFTGGNPLLYKHFNQLYREAAQRGFLLAILGNPAPRQQIEELVAIQKPEFYQVSLEGLQKHNDFMRGPGHFKRVLDFLALLKEIRIYSMVMLTLTQANKDEVIELAESLKGQVDQFTFNRLAMAGEGAALVSLNPVEFPEFLERYIEAGKSNPHMMLKDNLFNLVLPGKAMPHVGGCTGYGCGAAYNFVSLLPDGEVHACRKLYSPIGNIHKQHFNEIYQSEEARRYRAGSSACQNCEIRPLCGGCLAVSQGFGRDIFTELDPYCFRK